jgi:exosortase E/protease (VPEID-CTERM system)
MLAFATLGVATASSLVVGMLGNFDWLRGVLRRALLAGGLIGLAGWLAGTLSTELWAPLSRATFLTVASILQFLGFELFADYDQVILELEGFSITVAPVCSGFEGIGLSVALMGAYLYRVRDSLRFPQALLLLPLGMAAVWFGNSLRIAALMIVGARLDPEIAVGSFHSKAGWVFFCAITLAVAALSRASSFFSASPSGPSSPEELGAKRPTDASPFLVPLLTWIGIGLATSAFSDGHDPLYAIRVGVTAFVLLLYRRSYKALIERPTAAAWIVGALVGVAWLLVPPLLRPGASAPVPLPNWSNGFTVFWIATRALGAVLLVPFVEELAFRGFLARWLTKRNYDEVPYSQLTAAGIVGSSLAFGAVHTEWALAIFTGIIYGLLLRRSARLIDAITAHAASNLVIALWVVATGTYQYW